MIETVASVMLVIGLFFTLIGTLGVFRFEDVFLRLQAASKSLTFGLGFTILAAGLLSGQFEQFLKAVCIVGFQFLTAPIAAHLIARAALRKGRVPKKLHGWERRFRGKPHGSN